MSVLHDLEPKKVFAFFEEISQIPRGSGNTAQIAAYCMDFAKQRGLKAIHDAAGNVIIYAPGTSGYENSEPIILQGHMDMVCEKIPECTKNMETDGLTLCTDGEYVWAEGTTLGGDDGIALAYMFALLNRNDIPHPPIEAVITRDEETGMYGAFEFDPCMVKGKKVLNIDSEEEGILTVSCAGGVIVTGEIPVAAAVKENGFAYVLSVSGLTGGHSGADIHRGRQNAIKVLGLLLQQLSAVVDFRIAFPEGGGKANVIPKAASVVLVTENECIAALTQKVEQFAADFVKAYGVADGQAAFSVMPVVSAGIVYTVDSTANIIAFLNNAPNGIITMSEHMPGMVQTSLNLGVLTSTEDKLTMQFLIRSNSVEEKQSLMEQTEAIIRRYGGTATHDAGYPAWEYRSDSSLRKLMVETFVDQYGREPQVSAIHAGLECGIFAEKIKDADLISFGPDIENIHTPAERLNVASAARVWEYLKEVLKRCR